MGGTRSTQPGGETEESRKPAYFDRDNALKQADQGANNPGASTLSKTTQWSYTVPSGKGAFVEFLHALVENDSTDALNGNAKARIEYTPSGGSAQQILNARLQTGVASDADPETVGSVGFIAAGDKIAGVVESQNSATGTSVNLVTSHVTTEFEV